MINFKNLSRESLALFGLLIALCIGIWLGKLPDINWGIALSGWSSMDWVAHLNHPENFVRDFPNGVSLYDKSLFMHIYPLAQSWLGISPGQMIPYVILFEIVFLGIASVVFFRALVPNAPPFAGFLFAILVISSSAKSMDLANFGVPYFWGLHYNFADGMRLLAVAMVLQRRYLAASMLLSLSMLTHPIMGLMGAVFALGCFATFHDKGKRAHLYWAIGILLFVVGGWWLFMLRNTGLIGEGVAPDIWVSFTRPFSSHFYPVDNGTLTYDFERRLLPFMGMLLLAVFYVYRISLDVASRNGILLGSGFLLILTLAGLGISLWSTNPTLIKLALMRASDMLILVSLAIIVAGLVSDINKAQRFQAMVAAGLLFSPFLGSTFPLVYIFLAIVPQLILPWRKTYSAHDKVMLLLLFLLCAFVLMYYQLGFVQSHWLPHYIGYKQLLVMTLVMGLVLVVASRISSNAQTINKIIFVAMAACILGLALHWKSPSNFNSDSRAFGKAYLNAQLWAKKNTHPSALFMVDPTLYYGWRDFSERSSFGNLREWIHTSWLYDSSKKNFDEGMRRVSEFGILATDYLHDTPAPKGAARMEEDIRTRYYTYNIEWFEKLSKKYGIDYLVMIKKQLPQPLRLSIAYENDQFIIYKLTDSGFTPYIGTDTE